MEHHRIRVIIKTRGTIQNYEAHVALPLARIVANALMDMIAGTAQIPAEDVEIVHRTGIVFEADIDVSIAIETSYDDHIFHNRQTIHARIAQAIHQNGMFRCRSRHEPNNPIPINRVRLELSLGLELPALAAA